MKIVACKGETYLIRAFGPAVVLAVFTIYYIESFGLDWVTPVKQASIIYFPAVVIGTISLAAFAAVVGCAEASIGASTLRRNDTMYLTACDICGTSAP